MLTSSLSQLRQKRVFLLWNYFAPMLLLLAHVLNGVSLLFFGWHTGGYPLHLVGLGMYLTAVLFSVVCYGLWFVRSPKSSTITATLLMLSLPAFASLMLRAGLWMTPWLGGAAYAPWDPGDMDIVTAFNLFFAVLWSVVAVVYSSYRYLLVGVLAQLILYFATYALPHWVRYPAASLLSVQPGFPFVLLGLLIVGGIVIAQRHHIVGEAKPTLWLAIFFLTAVGSWVLYQTIDWLPNNGEELGWTAIPGSPALRVPTDAWGWSRPIAQYLALLAIITVPFAAILQQIRKKQAQSFPSNFRQ